jgi:hypothetical protein
MSITHRIDVHQHVVPPFWAKELPNHGGDPSGARSGDPTNTPRISSPSDPIVSATSRQCRSQTSMALFRN